METINIFLDVITTNEIFKKIEKEIHRDFEKTINNSNHTLQLTIKSQDVNDEILLRSNHIDYFCTYLFDRFPENLKSFESFLWHCIDNTNNPNIDYCLRELVNENGFMTFNLTFKSFLKKDSYNFEEKYTSLNLLNNNLVYYDHRNYQTVTDLNNVK